MTHTPEGQQARYKAGDRLYFQPRSERAPFSTIISAGPVEIIEVVDHQEATAYAPRFSYVVKALDESMIRDRFWPHDQQGTDDRELCEY